MALYLTIGTVNAVIFAICWLYSPFRMRICQVPPRLAIKYWWKQDDRWLWVIWTLLQLIAWPFTISLTIYFYWKFK